MAHFVFVLATLISLASTASGQCAAADDANCVYWVKNYFCTNYPLSMVQQYCPKSCANSGCNAVTTTAKPTTENANCVNWNKEPNNVFCATASPDQKKTFCPITCDKEINQVDDCAIYVSIGGSVVRSATNKSTTTPLATATSATDLLLDVFAKNQCTIALYNIATPTLTGAGATAPIHSYAGTGSSQFFKISDATEQAAVSIGCTCA